MTPYLTFTIVFFAFCFLCWMTWGKTPFAVLAAILLFCEVAVTLAFEIGLNAAKIWCAQVWPRYTVARFSSRQSVETL